MKILNGPSTSRNSRNSSISILKKNKNQIFARRFHLNKNAVVLLPMYGYSNEVIVGDQVQNYSIDGQDDEYINLEKALYSSSANISNVQSLGSNVSKDSPVNKTNNAVQAENTDEADIEETPDILLDSWDAYLRLEHPELFDKDFKLPD